MSKTRLDVRMHALGLCDSREKARALIMEGQVTVNGLPMSKAGAPVDDGDDIVVKERLNPYVSRGGLKLHKAVNSFELKLDGVVAIDVGASTGGFTDCMLQNGAKRVYAVDVGYGQLDWKLRSDGRVAVLERRNARNMEAAWFDDVPSFASMDVSFISIRLILPALYACLAENAIVMSLIKPQFEAGRDKVGKNGVVRSAETHIEVIERCASAAEEIGFTLAGLDFSPITGPKGNIEYLLLLTKGQPGISAFPFDIKRTVEAAHISFEADA